MRINVEYIPVDALKPYERNARAHHDEDVNVIVNSIQTFGFDDPIGIWGDENIIVEGHGRLMAAKKIGMKEVPCIRLDHLTDEQRKAYALVHNKSAELSEWDDELLDLELDELELTDIDMSDFGFELSDGGAETPEISEDNYDGEVPEEAKAKVGDVYRLGNHFLICGDCTDKSVIEKLMNGTKPDLLLTDPPYGIQIVSKGGVQSERGTGSVGGGGALHFRKGRRW